MKRIVTIITLSMAITSLSILTGLDNKAYAAVIKPCNQSTYDPKAPYTTYSDSQGKSWRCARNYAGRYVWYYVTYTGEPDPICDENHVGVDNEHIWQNSNGEYLRCELQYNGLYKWVHIDNPFEAPATSSHIYEGCCPSGVGGGVC